MGNDWLEESSQRRAEHDAQLAANRADAERARARDAAELDSLVSDFVARCKDRWDARELVRIDRHVNWRPKRSFFGLFKEPDQHVGVTTFEPLGKWWCVCWHSSDGERIIQPIQLFVSTQGQIALADVENERGPNGELVTRELRPLALAQNNPPTLRGDYGHVLLADVLATFLKSGYLDAAAMSQLPPFSHGGS